MPAVLVAALLIAAATLLALGAVVASSRRRRLRTVTVPARLADALVVDVPESTPLDPWIEFQRELKRSRRTERPLAMLRVAGRDAAMPAVQAAATIADRVRDVDRVWVDGDEVFVLLPETDDAAAGDLVGRLRAEAPAALESRTLTAATFPRDALTSEDLVARLRGAPPQVGLGDPETDGLTRIPGSAAAKSMAERAAAPIASLDGSALRAGDPGASNEIAS